MSISTANQERLEMARNWIEKAEFAMTYDDNKIIGDKMRVQAIASLMAAQERLQWIMDSFEAKS